MQVHITFIFHEFCGVPFAPYISPLLMYLFPLFLFTNLLSACAMLHIPILFVPLGILTVVENPHDNVKFLEYVEYVKI